MTQAQSDMLVGQLFKWTTSPLDSPESRTMAISRVAAIVCDTGSQWLTLATQPNRQLADDVLQLHNSYGRLKAEYVK
jgi:hypothetical protein